MNRERNLFLENAKCFCRCFPFSLIPISITSFDCFFSTFFLLLYCCSWCRRRYYPFFCFNKEYSCAHLPNGSPEGWISCFCTFGCRIERFAKHFISTFLQKTRWVTKMGRLFFFFLLCLYFHIFLLFLVRNVFLFTKRDFLCYRRFEFWWK